MIETIRLEPHDPLPDPGRHAVVLRRMGEDDPTVVVTELLTYGRDAGTAALSAGRLEEAVRLAQAEAERRGLSRLYVLDRTAGRLEREAVAEHGRSFPGESLDDSDIEDGEAGPDIRDRPHDAGYVR